MKKFVVVFLMSVLFFSCKNGNAPDVSSYVSDVKIYRTEKEWNQINNLDDFKKMESAHPAFYQIYLNEILPLEKTNSQDSLFTDFQTFTKDSLIADLDKKVIKKYENFEPIKKEIDQMYGYLQYYFPKFTKIPNFYTFISEFGYQIFIFEDDNHKDGIGIGLDMFMHPEIDYKKINPDNTNFSDYITRSWNQDYIVKKIADLHVVDLVGEAPGHRLIDQMIHHGKEMYITKLLLPQASDTIITEYTAQQLKFCEDNELQIWSFFFDQKLFYETNPIKIGKYINPSPNSPDMPADAPGRIANYIGWKVVNAYMERYPDTTLENLIAMTDSQGLLEKSKYKPRQK